MENKGKAFWAEGKACANSLSRNVGQDHEKVSVARTEDRVCEQKSKLR